MKKVLTVVLALGFLAAFSGPDVAQQKDTQKSAPAGEETKQPSTAAKNSAHATEQVMTGKVTEVNAKAKSFTVTAKGKLFTFSAAKLKVPLPKVGAIIDITYTQSNPNAPLVVGSIALNSSRSNVY
jgi:hypothetical protein